MSTEPTPDLMTRLAALRAACPDMRFGQLIATLGELVADMTDRTWWDIEDEELVTVLERFRQDLARRESGVAR